MNQGKLGEMLVDVEPQTAAAALKRASRLRPNLAIVLGSGFQPAVEGLRVDAEIPYSKIPGFPEPTVKGHAGKLFFGELGGTPVTVLSGRAHYYEGHSMERVTFPIRALAAFGIHDLLLTNAAGGIKPSFRIGDFMLTTDHINFMGTTPLRGKSHFVDLTQVYDPHLSGLVSEAARRLKMKLRRGVYLAVCGPNYETPAEIRAFATMGADAVGMSTVPEAIVARQWGLNVAAVSCITNAAAGLGKTTLSHADVLETAESVGKIGAELLETFAQLYGRRLENFS
ncbi:MAG TPA: purine-nucleoside phosphorylase [Verrucomicrobiae bacterium]|nr:purine-nucleoside phosphorylase [Verrucomicrobiae bacterium]